MMTPMRGQTIDSQRSAVPERTCAKLTWDEQYERLAALESLIPGPPEVSLSELLNPANSSWWSVADPVIQVWLKYFPRAVQMHDGSLEQSWKGLMVLHSSAPSHKLMFVADQPKREWISWINVRDKNHCFITGKGKAYLKACSYNTDEFCCVFQCNTNQTDWWLSPSRPLCVLW